MKSNIDNESNIELPSDFSNQIRSAFPLVGGVGKSMEDKQLFDLLLENGIDFIAAKEIVIFLPIAFVRCLLTVVDWPESYFENTLKSELIEKMFNETESYLRIMKETKEYFVNDPDKDIVVNIAGRSAEFRVLNQLLLDNPEAEVKDAIFTKTIINRHFDGSN